jgi:hypothetical protein
MSGLTEEQVTERLKAAGIDPSAWGAMGGHGPQTPKFALSIAADLKKVSALLQGVVDEKQVKVRSLEEQLARLRYGGGS